MAKKGKKKSKKKKEKKDDDEEGKENIDYKVVLPEFGWIRVEMKLCDPPSKFNSFFVVMRTDERILELKKRVIDFHGRVCNLHIYNRDPYPARGKDGRMQMKPRVPPFTQIKYLKQLMKEKEAKIKKDEEKAKKLAENGNQEDEEEKKNIYEEEEDPHRFDILDEYDFPEIHTGENIVEYNEKETSLY